MYEGGGAAVDTVYVGGGTPSALSVEQWERLDDRVFSRIGRERVVEWSVECNPESFTIEKAQAYAKSGATRLTFGVQSLNARELSICGRAHGAETAIEAVCGAGASGLFRSIGVDIIYALPGQTANALDSTLSPLLSIESIKHLSAYELTIAEGTPFGRRKSALRLPPEEAVAEMYGLIGTRCAERGMARYEVSNYAAYGFESVHNKAYWSHKPYIGLGASAHSYAHPRRWGNVADVNRYISLISLGKRAIGFEESLSPWELAEEIIFLGLRHAGGIDEDGFEARTGIRLCADGRGERLLGYVDSGLLKRAGRRWVPTPNGMLFADMMARGLLG
jgi:oxygen-independent coproporphyrinogen-3 oxidase